MTLPVQTATTSPASHPQYPGRPSLPEPAYGAFPAGYLAVWTAFAVLALLADQSVRAMVAAGGPVGVVLLAAGASSSPSALLSS
jgi:hypothetical protein